MWAILVQVKPAPSVPFLSALLTSYLNSNSVHPSCRLILLKYDFPHSPPSLQISCSKTLLHDLGHESLCLSSLISKMGITVPTSWSCYKIELIILKHLEQKALSMYLNKYFPVVFSPWETLIPVALGIVCQFQMLIYRNIWHIFYWWTRVCYSSIFNSKRSTASACLSVEKKMFHKRSWGHTVENYGDKGKFVDKI